jgi:hypothetical protein
VGCANADARAAFRSQKHDARAGFCGLRLCRRGKRRGTAERQFDQIAPIDHGIPSRMVVVG